jgi:hypothetical protein
VLPEECQEKHEHTLQAQPAAPAPCPQTPERRPQPRTPETYPLSWLDHLGQVTTEKPLAGELTLRPSKAVGNTSKVALDVDQDQQMLTESAGGNSLSNGPLPKGPVSNLPVPETHRDGSVDFQ